jgi:hypothetical protein
MSFLKSKHNGWTWELKRTPFGGGNPLDAVSSALGTDGGGGGLLGGLADLDKAVGQNVPGGWVTLGALGAAGAGAYFAPEIAAAFGGESALAGATSSFTPEMVAYANASADPIATISAMSGMSGAEFASIMAAPGAGAAGAAGGSFLGSLGSGLAPAALLGGANVLGSIYGATASKNAAQAQMDAASQANQLAYGIYQQNRADQMPYMQAGTGALKQLTAGTQPGGEFARDFSYAPFNYDQNTDPGTQFRLQQGLNAMNATAAARGGLISGNALKAGQDYGQAQGSQEYGAAFNRYLQNYGNAQNTFQVNRANRLNPLQSLAGVGQSAVNTTGTMGTNYANTAGGNITGAGNANAAGTIGAANSAMSGISGISNLYSQNSLLNAIQNQNRTAYS